MQAQLSRSLSIFLGKTEQQDWNNRGYLFRMPRVWWDNSEALPSKLQIISLVPWGKLYLKGFEEASKKKEYIAGKMS